eukprot:s615_g3.t3
MLFCKISDLQALLPNGMIGTCSVGSVNFLKVCNLRRAQVMGPVGAPVPGPTNVVILNKIPPAVTEQQIATGAGRPDEVLQVSFRPADPEGPGWAILAFATPEIAKWRSICGFGHPGTVERGLWKGMIVGVDNVLLDVVVSIDDEPDILKRYQVEANTQCLAEERHMPLVKDMLSRAEAGKASTTPGGVIANSLRAGSWWLKRQADCQQPRRIMLGMVGHDAAGDRLQTELSAAGVEPMLGRPARKEEPNDDLTNTSGVCCCLLANKARTMVTHLGISKTLHLDGKTEGFAGWISRMEMLQASIKTTAPQAWAESLDSTCTCSSALCFRSEVAVTSGFYAQADPEGVDAMLTWCSKPHVAAAGRILPMFAITEAARSADFTFANEAASKPAPETYEDAMAVIARWKQRGWMIGTRGSKGVGCIRSKSDTSLFQVPVPPVSPEEFVDDVGAGDSFMGGFLEAIWQSLAALAQEETVDSSESAGKRKLEDVPLASKLTDDNMKDAVRAGITAAGACIRCSGCQFAG